MQQLNVARRGENNGEQCTQLLSVQYCAVFEGQSKCPWSGFQCDFLPQKKGFCIQLTESASFIKLILGELLCSVIGFSRTWESFSDSLEFFKAQLYRQLNRNTAKIRMQIICLTINP